MKYIKTYENFTPIKINSHKPFKIKKNIDKSLQVLQKGLKALKKRLPDERNMKNRSEIIKTINQKNHKFKDLNFKKLKQAEYLKNNPIDESVEEQTENLDVILSTITEDNYEKVLDYIGLDKDDYEIKYKYYDRNFLNESDFTILINSRDLENMMNIEEGIINYLLQISSYYNNYTYEMDDNEYDYIQSYLSGNTLSEVKILGETFDFDIDPEEEGSIYELFLKLGLKEDLKDIKSEIEMENERAVEKAAEQIIELLPFSVENSNDAKKNLELSFNYQEIIDYIKKHNLKVKTFKDLLENIYDSDEFSYEFEYGDLKYKNLGNFEEVNSIVSNVCTNYINSPDEIFPKLIVIDNLELIKKKKELSDFVGEFTVQLDYDRSRYTLFGLAIELNNNTLQWFKSFEFQQWFIEKDIYGFDKDDYKSPMTTKFKFLCTHNILNPKIEDEYDYLIDSEKYNL